MIKKIFRKGLALCFLLLSLTSGSAQDYQGLLWEVSGKELSHPSYLFGTIHLTDKRVFDLPDSLLKFMGACETFAGELKLTGEDYSSIQQDLVRTMLMPADTTLKMLLPRDKYKKVKKAIRKKQGIKGLIMLNKIKPVYLSFLLAEDKEQEEHEMGQFLDKYLQDIALDSGLAVTGLETPAEQIKALECMSLKKQAEMLFEHIESETDAKDLSEDMIRAYIREDLDSIYAFFNMDMMPKELTESLLSKRNFIMAERMEKMILEGPVFFAVGAAHLPGNGGIIELLREKGYTVRPVSRKY